MLLPTMARPATFVADLMHFYSPQDHHPNVNDLFDAVDGTEDAAAELCIEDQVDTMLAMWHRESRYEKKASDGHSLGIAQTTADEIGRWKAFWLKRGIKLPPFQSARTQAYYGVAEFYTKLQVSHGKVFEAVRRYNGSGPRARSYAWRVMKSRRNIFKRPYVPGERQDLGCN